MGGSICVRRVVRRSVAVVVVLLVGAAGCSGSPDAAGPDSTSSPEPSMPSMTGSSVPGSLGTTVLRDPLADVSPDVPSPDAVVRARTLMDQVRDQLPFDDAVQTCLVDRLARNGPLLDAAQGELSVSSPVFRDVLVLGQACVQSVTFAPQFVAGVERQVGTPLSAEQRQCLLDGYLALPAETLSEITRAAVDATAPGRADAMQKTNDLVAGCGVPVG